MTGTSRTASQADSPPRPHDRQRAWGLADWLLVVAALSSAGWACIAVSAETDAPLPRTMVLDAGSYGAEPLWFIDETNMIRWPTGSADGGTSLAFALTSAPADVVVLVHPDSLVEPLVRTIGVLRQAGAQRVHVAISENDPFPSRSRLPSGTRAK